jgi:hypothetical protein
MNTKVVVRKETHYKPHADFYQAASDQLKHIEDKAYEPYASLLSVLLLSAFALEAYLNFIGPTVEPGWDDFDKCPTLAKLRHICSVLGVAIDFGSSPFQSASEVFKFRNKMAHPRDEEVVAEYEDRVGHFEKSFYEQPKPKWLAFATEDNAKRCHADIGKIIKVLNEKLPKPDPSPLNVGHWHGLAQIKAGASAM